MIRSCGMARDAGHGVHKRDYTALLVPSVGGANLVRLAHTRLGVEVLRTPSEREHDEFLRRPPCLRRADPLSAQPDRRRTVSVRRPRIPLSDYPSRGEQLPSRHPQKPAVRGVEGRRDARRDADRNTLLFECGLRMRSIGISRTPSSARSPTGFRPKGWSRR